MERVITARQFQAARARSRMTNRQLASLLDVSVSTISNWLREGVVSRSEADVEDKLGLYLRDESPGGNPLKSFSDVELLAELWQRMDSYKRQFSPDRTDTTPMGESGPTGDEASEAGSSVSPTSLGNGVITGTIGKRPRPKNTDGEK
jgi:transcriptional regulator with XRE-family HTH domain